MRNCVDQILFILLRVYSRTNIFLVTKKRQSSKSQYYNDYKIRKFNLVI